MDWIDHFVRWGWEKSAMAARHLAPLAVGGLLLLGGWQMARGQQKTDAQAATKSTTAVAATYVGSDTCKACHDAEYSSWEKSAHFATSGDTRGGPAKQGCEACHGPGSAHVEDPSDKTKIFVFDGAPAEKINSRCLECHASGKEQMNFSRSEHAHNNVSCLDCHSIHHAQDTTLLLIKDQPQLCFGCHLAEKTQFNMPVHHRVPEGLVKCSDCHNPHGGFGQTQLRTASAQDQVCFTCHVDKRGPFVFEHEAVKTEGCTACHTPHGSPNPHLLKFSNVNLICLQCHTASDFSGAPGTPSFHNQAAQFQACTLCHTQIHGSNFDPDFFK
jgi:DmsE family decaheme c-type cytochrome